ncbi:right-handed parallel beta-helix repeat-containing protein [Mariniflexile gromovii]|uniref:Right-handed parallel beta-helix repeat-containing protein n=1 Tax=Mariniflexile gromovii TaxID=362523 RepID=A0ABS4BPG0_9FLAO|nr:right-handed parallel beta-helix repeat-containing protein [Mariniflexile gromovii]MBP0902477.1 right-handed parallel beta-helix repeat-containing protein [Mariniflexile gromovii]
MKMINKPMLYLFFVLLSVMACNNEELFIDESITEVVEGTDQPEDNTDIVKNNTPCNFDLSTIQANQTVVINCVMDLGGATINLPSNVTIVYEGGDIINGTINFSSQNVISGELLNSTLTISGYKPQIKDPVFNFDPKRWGIVEGNVSQTVAKNNKNIINSIIKQIKELGINTLKIDKLDAYFYGETEWSYAMDLPSDFNLIMTPNTKLRVFPTNTIRPAPLVMIQNSTNVTVTGGYLYGERDEHDYSINGTHEQGHLIVIKTGINVKIENVHMSNSVGDGLDIESYRFAYDPLYVPSKNILITGCTFDSNRRNNMSITDGEDIIVENNTFLNAGINTAKSNGTAPKCAIDIEPDIHDYNAPWQQVKRVIIRNNTERGSARESLEIFTGDDILVTGNDFEKHMGISRAFNVKVVNNQLGGIDAGISEITDPRNYEVSGNVIKSEGYGIFASNPGVKIFNNTITDCSIGILAVELKDANIYNNTIKSKADGINLRGGGNVKIDNNIIDVDRPFFFQGANDFTISNNTVNALNFGAFESCSEFKINNNSFNNGLRLSSSSNGVIQANNFKIINSTTAINIREQGTKNLQILGNYFENTDTQGYDIFAEGNSAWGNANITVSDNQFNNTGVRFNNFNGVTFKNNISTKGSIYFIGNNSYFENNRGFSGELLNHNIQGSNNTIIK